MKPDLQKVFTSLFLLAISFYSRSQVTNTYTTPTTWTVPAGVTSISIKVYGGAAGHGGQDCGDGCSNAAGGEGGYVEAVYTVSPGNTIGIYPGGMGTNGGDNESGAGGGTGGTGTYPFANYDGGRGGDAGPSGASGAGGGGGAASVVTINTIIRIVAGGAGGGGGMANLSNSGYDGNSTTASNGSTTGGDGTTPGGDGGGGGGSGGGQFASAGGDIHPAGGEDAGDGGYRGSNSVNGASTVLSDGSIAWSNDGQIEISYMVTLPVTWLSFTAVKNNKTVRLSWSTAAEVNAWSYEIQRSSNGMDWINIGTVIATGNSIVTQQYRFIDLQPFGGMNYYRLLQRDIDQRIQYSKVLFCDLSNTGTALKVYPNPVINGSAAVYLRQAGTIKLFNSSGKEVLKMALPAGSSLLDLAGLPKGTYYIRCANESLALLLQ